LLALLSNRSKQFLRDWAIFLGLVMLFDSMRGLVFVILNRFDVQPYYNYVIKFDYWLFGGKLATYRFQQWLGTSFQPNWIDKFSAVMYGSHFLFFLFFGVFIWHFKERDFWRYEYSFLIMMYVGLICYLLFPTAPPWMVSQAAHMPYLHTTAFELYNVALPKLYDTFATNPIAAMPALHAAFPVLCVFIAAYHYGWKGFIPVFIYFLGVVFSTLYTPSHYVLDILAAIVLAAIVFYLVYCSSLQKYLLALKQQVNKLALTSMVLIAVLLILLAQGVSFLNMYLLGKI